MVRATDIEWASKHPDDPAAWEWSLTAKGVRHSNLHNVGIAVSHDVTLQKLVWYDEFLDRLLTGPGREWSDHDDVNVCIRLQDTYGLTSIRPSMVREVLSMRAAREPRHVVREYLQGLRWDGVPRIVNAIMAYWGAEPGPLQPADYLRAASSNFLISLVARVMRPGCKVDTMPVFEGPQGIYKSSALEALGGSWHVVSHESVTSKDFFQVLQGGWIIELGELDTISRAEVTRVKSVISTRVDRYRASYARSAVDHQRQCVFAGTTNADNWGRDETGLRRFWPIKCGRIRLGPLREVRDQLFAEAMTLFEAGATWWEMPESAMRVQADRQEESAIGEAIDAWCAGRSEVTVYEVLTGALRLESGRIVDAHERKVGRWLRLAGWEKRNRRREGKQTKVWISPEAAKLEAIDEDALIV